MINKTPPFPLRLSESVEVGGTDGEPYVGFRLVANGWLTLQPHLIRIQAGKRWPRSLREATSLPSPPPAHQSGGLSWPCREVGGGAGQAEKSPLETSERGTTIPRGMCLEMNALAGFEGFLCQELFRHWLLETVQQPFTVCGPFCKPWWCHWRKPVEKLLEGLYSSC